MKGSIIFWIFLVTLTACGSTYVDGDKEEQPLEGYDGYSLADKKACDDAGGNYIKFNNGCVDSCVSIRSDGVFCTQALMYSCECGPERCWNGETCELN